MGDPKVIEAGRELDALIAAKVMGDYHFETAHLVSGRAFWWKHDGEIMESPPPYSTDIAVAWQIVEKAIDYDASTTDFDCTTGLPTKHKWELWFPPRGDEVRYGRAFARTAPLAICLAALAAAHVR